MEVGDRLTAIFITVDHQTITLLVDPLILGNLGSGEKQAGEQISMIVTELVNAGEVAFWNQEDVGGSLGIQIRECLQEVVLLENRGLQLVTGDLAKDTGLAHPLLSTSA